MRSGPLGVLIAILGGINIVTALSFRNYNLPESFLTALDQRGFNEPTPVQNQVLSQPDLNIDMVVQARTGSGKTLAFLLPLLSQLEGGSKKPKILVLSPTRELAMQNASESEFFGHIRGIETAAIVGGMSMEHQILQLRHGVVQGLLGVVGLLVLLLSSGVDLGGVGVYVLGIVEFHLEDTYLHGDDVLGRVYVGHVGDLECTLGEFLP